MPAQKQRAGAIAAWRLGGCKKNARAMSGRPGSIASDDTESSGGMVAESVSQRNISCQAEQVADGEAETHWENHRGARR